MKKCKQMMAAFLAAIMLVGSAPAAYAASNIPSPEERAKQRVPPGNFYIWRINAYEPVGEI